MEKKIFILFFVASLFCLFAPGLHASTRMRIAVFDFKANNTPEADANIVRNTLEVFLYKSNSFSMLERESIEIILREQKVLSLKCQNTMCAVKIGKFVSADYVITGSLDYTGKYLIHVRVIDVRKNKIVFADQIQYAKKDNVIRASTIIAGKIKDFLIIFHSQGSGTSVKYTHMLLFKFGYIPVYTEYSRSSSPGKYSGIPVQVDYSVFINTIGLSLALEYQRIVDSDDNAFTFIGPLIAVKYMPLYGFFLGMGFSGKYNIVPYTIRTKNFSIEYSKELDYWANALMGYMYKIKSYRLGFEFRMGYNLTNKQFSSYELNGSPGSRTVYASYECALLFLFGICL